MQRCQTKILLSRNFIIIIMSKRNDLFTFNYTQTCMKRLYITEVEAGGCIIFTSWLVHKHSHAFLAITLVYVNRTQTHNPIKLDTPKGDIKFNTHQCKQVNCQSIDHSDMFSGPLQQECNHHDNCTGLWHHLVMILIHVSHQKVSLDQDTSPLQKQQQFTQF